VNTERRFDS